MNYENVAAFTRFKDDVHHKGLLASIRSYAQDNDIEIKELFVDFEGGMFQLEEMTERCSRWEFDCIVVNQLSEIDPDPLVIADYKAMLQSYGTDLVCLSKEATPLETMTLDILGVVFNYCNKKYSIYETK